MDVEGKINPGDDFAEVITEQVGASDIVLVVIGPHWLSVLNDRLSNEDDFVRIEVREALRQERRVIPVLVGRSTMPSAEDLPSDIRRLSRLNAVEIRPDRFNADLKCLIAALKALPPPKRTPKQISRPIRGRVTKSGVCRFQLPAKVVHAALSKVMFAMSDDELRYYLNGVYLHADESGLHFVATDGHRLALVTLANAIGLTAMPDVILTREDTFELFAFLHRQSLDARLAVATDRIDVSVAGRLFRCQPIEGRYPMYRKVIPNKNGISVTFRKADLKEALLAASSPKQARPYVTFQLSPDSLSVRATRGGDVFDVPAKISTSASITVSFNARYVEDALRHIDSDDICLNFSDGGMHVALFEGLDMADAAHVVMPLRF